MASKTGSFLRISERKELLMDLQKKGELKSNEVPESVKKEALELVQQQDQQHQGQHQHKHGTRQNSTKKNSDNDNDKYGNSGVQCGTGCLACGGDDDHANLLLCESCNAEYHTYCLEPPLRAVPTWDWYCSDCKATVEHLDDDGLDLLVNALTPCFTSRFGEVCWAQGGVGFGWWPAFIYDPRHTTGLARTLARKNLGRRHLVYFFGCHDAPFSVLSTAKITKWETGLIDDLHLGKVARGAGQKRTKAFQQALQAATIEATKPIEMRLDWNHSEQPQILPSPQTKKVPPPARKRRRREVSPVKRPLLDKPSSKLKPQSRPRGFPFMTETSTMVQVPTRRNLNSALDAITTTSNECASPIVELVEDGELFVKLLKKENLPIEDSSIDVLSDGPGKNVGFVKLLSRKSNTFADARIVIEQELVPDTLPSAIEWKFFIPGLGPVSNKQETSLGPMLSFLRRTTLETNLGGGTLIHPLKVFIIELKTTTAIATATITS